MRVAEVVSKGILGIREQRRPTRGTGELLLRVGRAGICGSDLRYLPHAPQGGVIGHEFTDMMAVLAKPNAHCKVLVTLHAASDRSDAPAGFGHE